MKILVLGASGYLGESVFRRLYDQKKYDVLGTYNRSSRKDDLVQLSIYNENQTRKLIKEFNPDIIIWCIKDNGNEEVVSNKGLNNLLDLISPNKRLIYVSTDGFFEGKGNYSEDVDMIYYASEDSIGRYVNNKINGENLIIKNHKNYAILRIGPIYGKNINGNWDKRINDLMIHLSANKVISRTSNLYKTFIHVEDLVSLIVEIIEHDYIGVLHVGPEDKESYYSFNKKMAKQLKLDDSLISEDRLTVEEANKKGIPLDTSMNTSKCRNLFNTHFRIM